MVATTFTVSGAVLKKAGAKVNSSISGGTVFVGSDFIVDLWIVEAEAEINAITRKNWTSAFSGLTAATRRILDKTASALAAMHCIKYDMSGYTSRYEAEVMLNVLDDEVNRGLKLLADQEVKTYLGG